jgi:integrase
MTEHVKTLARPDVPLYRIKYLLQWWEKKRASDIKPKACRAYIEWRLKQVGVRGPIQEGTARKDLETLRAALRFYHEEQPLMALPVVKLPKKPGRREEWLTRNQAAALIWAAWRNPDARHLARFALIIFYSGTRPGAVLKLKWCASEQGGWIDLDHNKLYRRGENEQETLKRRTPAPIHKRLIPHLNRWRKLDRQIGMEYVIHHNGCPVTKLRRSWRTACKTAGLSEKVVPHTGRHTAATWLMQAGVSPWEAAGYLGMSVDTLIKHYGHHSPDYQEQAACAVAPKQQRNGRKADESPPKGSMK